MTLPSTGSISMSQVNTELGYSSSALITLNDTAVRSLADVPSGAISMSNLRGKSANPTLVFDNGNNFYVEIRKTRSSGCTICDIQLGLSAGGSAGFTPSSNTGPPIVLYQINSGSPSPTKWTDPAYGSTFGSLFEMALGINYSGMYYSGNLSTFYLIDYNDNTIATIPSGFVGIAGYYDMANGVRLYARAGATSTTAVCDVYCTLAIRRKSNTSDSISRTVDMTARLVS